MDDRDIRDIIEQYPLLRDYRFHTILTIVLAAVGLAASVPINVVLSMLTPIAKGVFIGGGVGAGYYTLREVEQWSKGDPLNWDKFWDALGPIAAWLLATGIAQYLTAMI